MNKKTILLLLSFAMLIVIGTHLLFKPMKEIQPSASAQTIQQVDQKMNQLNTSHKVELNKLKKNNDFLLAKIKQSKKQVQSIQKHSNYLQQSLQQSLQSLSSQQPLLNNEDTSSYVVQCDSLQNQINDFISIENNKDSIVNEQFLIYEELIIAKDSTIQCFESDYAQLQTFNDTLNKVNNTLLLENRKVSKKYARIKNRNRIFYGTAFIIAGIFTANQLRSIP